MCKYKTLYIAINNVDVHWYTNNIWPYYVIAVMFWNNIFIDFAKVLLSLDMLTSLQSYLKGNHSFIFFTEYIQTTYWKGVLCLIKNKNPLIDLCYNIEYWIFC